MNFLDNFLNNCFRLAVAQIVDDAVELIDFSLVAAFSNLEVVSAVRSLEFVDETCVQLNPRIADVIFDTVSTPVDVRAVQNPVDRRFDEELELFCATKVVCKVKSCF